MSCCISSTLCDPATGEPVIVGLDLNDGITSYVSPNGTAWTGDPTTLEACETDLVVTINGSPVGVAQSGDADHIVDLTIPDTDVCAVVQSFPVTGDVPNDGVTGELLMGIDANGDCVLFDPPQGCCIATANLCAPDGTPVIVAMDIGTGTATYWDATTALAWTGTPADLVDCAALNTFNKVAADGTVSAFDSAVDCTPEFAFQSVVDHHGDQVLAASKASPLTLHRSLVIDDAHVGGATGVGGADFIGVSHADSNDAGISNITTHHLYAVYNSFDSTASSAFIATAIGGQLLSATGARSVVAGGLRNSASGGNSATLGGADNLVDGPWSVNAGGQFNETSGLNSLTGGDNNDSNGDSTFTHGSGNTVDGNWNLTAGTANDVSGNANQVTGQNTDVDGGSNVAAGKDNSVIVGPSGNAPDNNLVVGSRNTVTNFSNVVGGDDNVVNGYINVVAGGNNVVEGYQSLVVGGSNTLTANGHSALIGGNNNTADSENNLVGGSGSIADGVQAGVWGTNAEAHGSNSFAFGNTAVTTVNAGGGFVAGGLNGLVDDISGFSASGGIANAGTPGTFAHGNGTGAGAFIGTVAVGFRGAPPQPARAVTTLADVILALQEQGLVI